MFGICPLIENDFSKMKSCIKFYEYTMLGLPCMASAVHPYIDEIIHEKTGILVKNTTDDWIKNIDMFVKQNDFRNAIFENAKSYILTNHILESNNDLKNIIDLI